MSAMTAASIMKALERQRFQADMAALAALDSTHAAAVRRELTAVKPGAWIDLGVLIQTVRAQISAQALGLTAEDRAYIRADLARWRAECERRGVTDPAARYGLMLEMQAARKPRRSRAYEDIDDELDPGLDENDVDDAKPRRRPMRRKRLLRLKRVQREPEQQSRA